MEASTGTNAPTSVAMMPPVVEFVGPIPGFPDDHEFALAAFFPDYAPTLAAADLACLGVGTDDELALLVIITLTDRLADATAHLLAPIVLAPRSGLAAHSSCCGTTDSPCVL